MEQNRIPLAELLGYIASELREAHEKAIAGGKPVMKFQECELEFAIEAEGKKGGGLQVWVLKLEGGMKRTESNIIKIKYTALDGPASGGSVVAEVKGAEGSLTKPKRQGRKGK